MTGIVCEFHYDSAHRLPHVPLGHKCGNLHGHTYRLLVEVSGPVRDDGFVVDFADVKDAVKPWVEQVDHRFLNNVAGLENPTVERQLEWFWARIELPGLTRLTIFEGLNNHAHFP